MYKTISILILTAGCTSLCSQNLPFFNTNQSLVSLNPSFAGSNGQLRNQASFSRQWANFEGAPAAYCNAVDYYSERFKSGFAASLSHQNVGPLRSSDVAVTYARYFSSREDKIRIVPSVQIGLNQRIVDDMWIVPSWSASPSYELRQTNLNISAGALLDVSRQFFLGMYYFNFNQPDDIFGSSYGLRNYMVLHGSYSFRICKGLAGQAIGVFEQDMASNNYKAATNFLLFDHIIVGAGLSIDREFHASSGYRNEFFSALLGYSPAPAYSKTYHRGTWELHAAFSLRKKADRQIFTSFETI